MATASRGRCCDTWDMGIGASGRSLLSIEVPIDSELPFSVSLQSRRRMRGHAYLTLRERGGMGISMSGVVSSSRFGTYSHGDGVRHHRHWGGRMTLKADRIS